MSVPQCCYCRTEKDVNLAYLYGKPLGYFCKMCRERAAEDIRLQLEVDKKQPTPTPGAA